MLQENAFIKLIFRYPGGVHTSPETHPHDGVKRNTIYIAEKRFLSGLAHPQTRIVPEATVFVTRARLRS